jgi:hypothetical protein
MWTALQVVGLVAFNLVLGIECGWAIAETRRVVYKVLIVASALPLVLVYGILLDRVLS